MRCRRIRRELLWLARFGEFGPSSQPHLDHLAGCAACRDEVGYDREMVRQLRIALAERIEQMQPSPSAWETILERAQSPEPGRLATWWSRSIGMVGRLRTATAMAGTGLALLLALNMEVLPAAAPVEGTTDGESVPLVEVPRLPTGRTALVVLVRQSQNHTIARPDPESALTGADARMASRDAAPAAGPVEPVPAVQVVFRPQQSPEPEGIGAGSPGVSDAPATPTPTEPGRPS